MHNAMNLQPPRSPISPSSPEVEIPSVEERVQDHMDSGYVVQYGNIFYPDVGATSSTPLPGEGVFGPYTFHGAGSSHQPPHTSEADQITARMSDAIFGGPYDMYSIATSSLNPSLDTATTSLEATTLPENTYLTSNLWIGIHDWINRTPSDSNGNGGHGQ